MDGMRHGLDAPSGLALGTVTDTADPARRGRVQVAIGGYGVSLWAPVIVASAGVGYGVAALPRLGEIVMLAFLSPDQPFVLGAVWSGASAAPNEADPVQDRYVVRTPAGTVLLFDDKGPSLVVTTPAGNTLTLTDAAGGAFHAVVGPTSVEATASAVTVQTTGTVTVQASGVTVSAPQVTVNAAMSRFSGAIQCDAIIANTVMGTSYTPGAGNLW